MEDRRRDDILALARMLGVGERSIPCWHCNGSCPTRNVGHCFGNDFGLVLRGTEATINIVVEDNASDR